jgi:ubiquinol-cytochrome c reductase subunit 6
MVSAQLKRCSLCSSGLSLLSLSSFFPLSLALSLPPYPLSRPLCVRTPALPVPPCLCPPLSLSLRCLQAQEEAADPVCVKPKLEEKCHKPCKKQWTEIEKCQERVKAKGHGSCEPWNFDYWKCIDACVSCPGGHWESMAGAAPAAALQPGLSHTSHPPSPSLSSLWQAAPKLFAALK